MYSGLRDKTHADSFVFIGTIMPMKIQKIYQKIAVT